MVEDEVWRRWRADDVVWGTTFCEAPRCMRAAVLLAESDEHGDVGVPLCVPCGDRLFERQAALAIAPRMELPEVWERERRRPPRRLSDWEIADRSPEKWLAEQQGVDTSNPDWDIPW